MNNTINKTTKPKSEFMEKTKYYLNKLALIILFCLVVGVSGAVYKANGQTTPIDVEKKNALSQANEAAEAFVRVMGNENEDVFLALLEETDCAVVFPSISKADYLELKDGRRGMASCRIDKSWGASVFVILKTPTVNKERRQSDLVFFFKTKDDLTNMLTENVKFGKTVKFKEFNSKITKFDDSTDVLVFGNIDSDIDVKSLTKGSISEGKSFMRKTYGRGTNISGWLNEPTKYAPMELYSFNRSIKNFERGNK